jgi:hypothetical protein
MKRWRNFGRRWWLGISIALLCCSTSGCAKRAVYVDSERQLVRLKAGEAAPREGVLVSPGYLAEMFEALGRGAQGKQ